MSIFTDIKESAAGRELSVRWYRDRVRALGELRADKIIREEIAKQKKKKVKND